MPHAKAANLLNQACRCLSSDRTAAGSDCRSLRGPNECWPWWHSCNKLFTPHMKASCHRLTEQFHSIEIHFDITGDIKPFRELLQNKILSDKKRLRTMAFSTPRTPPRLSLQLTLPREFFESESSTAFVSALLWRNKWSEIMFISTNYIYNAMFTKKRLKLPRKVNHFVLQHGCPQTAM